MLSVDRSEIKLLAGRRVNFEYFQHIIRKIAERVRHAGRYEDNLIGPDRVARAIRRQRPLPPPHDVDVIGL